MGKFTLELESLFLIQFACPSASSQNSYGKVVANMSTRALVQCSWKSLFEVPLHSEAYAGDGLLEIPFFCKKLSKISEVFLERFRLVSFWRSDSALEMYYLPLRWNFWLWWWLHNSMVLGALPSMLCSSHGDEGQTCFRWTFLWKVQIIWNEFQLLGKFVCPLFWLWPSSFYLLCRVHNSD